MAEAPPPSEHAPPQAKAEVTAPLTEAQALGRRIAFIAYLVVALAVATGGGVQVFSQAFARHAAPELSVSSCQTGLARLVAAVDRARTAASVTDGEDAALEHFRQALRPDWDDRDHIEDLCRASPESMAALDAIERLRYAEEHAARREAAELAPLRRRVQAMAPLWAPPTGSTSAVPSASATGLDRKNP